MLYSQIIYEKSFPKISMEDYDLMIENTKKELPSHKHPDSQTFLKNLFESMVSIVIPERMENRSFFLPWQKKSQSTTRWIQ